MASCARDRSRLVEPAAVKTAAELTGWENGTAALQQFGREPQPGQPGLFPVKWTDTDQRDCKSVALNMDGRWWRFELPSGLWCMQPDPQYDTQVQRLAARERAGREAFTLVKVPEEVEEFPAGTPVDLPAVFATAARLVSVVSLAVACTAQSCGELLRVAREAASCCSVQQVRC